MDNKELVILAAKGGPSGGSVTPESIVTATGQMTYAQQAATAQNIGVAPLRLTATPTAGPSDTTLMSGTWSGATWEEVVAAIQNSRLIQVDVATIGKITLLYNMGSATNASSNAFVYNVGGTLYNVFVELLIVGGNNSFNLEIINARTKTVNVAGATPTITPSANTVYQCGELTSLTISNPPASGRYCIKFVSGSTPTATVIPPVPAMRWQTDNNEPPQGFPAANTRYEINVDDTYVVLGEWPVPGVSA